MRDLPKFHIESNTLKKLLKKADGNFFLHDQEQMDYDPNAPHDDDTPTQPDEEDCVIQAGIGTLGSGYGVSCGGKFIGKFPEVDDALTAIKNWQDKNKFFPNIWFINDHGNRSLIDNKGNIIKSWV